jgi:hypothetical protein
MINLDELEALAKAATPGPWEYDEIELELFGKNRNELMWPSCDRHGEMNGIHIRDDDGRFIAAANPQAVLELIAHNRLFQSNYNDAQRLIIEQQQTIARLRTELAARTSPPAVAPYHRLDSIQDLPPPRINAAAEEKLFKDVWIGVTAGSAAYIESLYERWLKHGDWIPCADAMPFDSIPVLVAVDGEHTAMGGIWRRGRWETWEEGKEYQHPITHWLPLPRLPFDGEDDEYQL